MGVSPSPFLTVADETASVPSGAGDVPETLEQHVENAGKTPARARANSRRFSKVEGRRRRRKRFSQRSREESQLAVA